MTPFNNAIGSLAVGPCIAAGPPRAAREEAWAVRILPKHGEGAVRQRWVCATRPGDYDPVRTGCGWGIHPVIFEAHRVI